MNKKNSISDDIRKSIILNLNKGKSIREVSELLGCSKDQVFRVKKAYDSEGRTNTRKRGKAPKNKISEDMASFILDVIDIDCTIRLKDLKFKIFEKYEITVSEKTISKLITDFNYSFKRVGIITEKSNSPEVKMSRYNYIIQFLRLLSTDKKIFYFDETGFSISIRAKYGRSPVNVTPKKSTVALRSKNLSLACCMSKDGILAFKCKEGPYNSEHLYQYLIEIFQKCSSEGIVDATFICDNVPFHKTQLIKNSFTSFGHQIMYLPPYSPFLNPIEEMFSKLKRIVSRVEPKNMAELLTGINNAHTQVSISDTLGYFNHMKTYIDACLNRDDI